MSLGAGCDDPWMHSTDTGMQHHDLDLVDGSGPDVDQAQPCVHATGWITRADAHTFVHGCATTNHRAKAETYQALRMTLREPFLGLITT